MMMKFVLASAALVATTTAADAGAKTMPSNVRRNGIPINGMLNKEALPSTGEHWMTAKNGMVFQPAGELSPLAQLHLRKLTDASDTDTVSAEDFRQIYVDGGETYYDEYAQAWRALGWYIDCNYQGDGNDQGNCPRLLLWAAYVDEGYAGNGVGEYMYYDRHSNSWSDYACKTADSSRCVKMDCHEPNTHFSLLGFFVEPGYDQWMEQLFKHEGDCVWTDKEFQFMQTNRESWPTGCTQSSYVDSSVSDNPIYYDLKPEKYGSMSIGLYTDADCIVEYKNDKLTAEQIIMSMENGVSYSLEQHLKQWNSAFDVYKQCQPCKAYDLTYFVAGRGTVYNATGNRHAQYNVAYGGDDADVGADEQFHCHDAAGYDDVNQCMKFTTKTDMVSASWADVTLAGEQGTITGVTLTSIHHSKKTTFGHSLQSQAKDHADLMAAWVVVLLSGALCAFSIYRYKEMRDEFGETSKEPLLASEGVTA